MEKINKLFWVSRPISWVNTAFPFAAGYLLTVGHIDAFLIIGTIYFLWPYNLFLYGINDVFDYESDILNPRKGGVEGMKEARSFHPTIIKATIISNIPFLIYLIAVGNLLATTVLIITLFAVAAYSVVVLRFKERPVIDSITSSIHFVGPLIYGLSFTDINPEVYLYIIPFFLWGMASHAFGAVQDVIPDRKAKLSSIATVFGARWTVRISLLMYLLAGIILGLSGGYMSALGLISIIYILNIGKYWNIPDSESDKTNVAWKRFIWLNYLSGFVVTIAIILSSIFL